MKKNLIVFAFFVIINSINGQNFIKLSANQLYFTEVDYTSEKKLGLEIAIRRQLFQEKLVRLMIDGGLDFKRTQLSYRRSGGKLAGSTVSGNINFLDLGVDTRVRIGKRFFCDLGFWGTFALLKKIFNGVVVSDGYYIPTSSTTSTYYPPTTSAVTNETKDFRDSDGGFLVGTGYAWEKVSIELNFAIGQKKILDTAYLDLKSRRFNLSVVFPIKLKNKKPFKHQKNG